MVRLIRRQLIKRSLDMIAEIAGREDKKVGGSCRGCQPFLRQAESMRHCAGLPVCDDVSCAP